MEIYKFLVSNFIEFLHTKGTKTGLSSKLFAK